jgi:hypothetical protein
MSRGGDVLIDEVDILVILDEIGEDGSVPPELDGKAGAMLTLLQKYGRKVVENEAGPWVRDVIFEKDDEGD